MLMAHQGVFIASPEYSASVTPLLKNTIDWISRVRDRGEPTYAAFKGRVFAIGAATIALAAGMRSLMALRQILELGCGALVIPEQVAVPRAEEAFDDARQSQGRGARPRRSKPWRGGWSNWPALCRDKPRSGKNGMQKGMLQCR